MKHSLLASSALVATILAHGAAQADPVAAADPHWLVVDEEQLRELRGGVDLGPLVGDFSIQRTVAVDGTVVAQMQIVISNLSRLGNGGMPTVNISGPLTQFVQILNASGAGATVGTVNIPAPAAVAMAPPAIRAAQPSMAAQPSIAAQPTLATAASIAAVPIAATASPPAAAPTTATQQPAASPTVAAATPVAAAPSVAASPSVAAAPSQAAVPTLAAAPKAAATPAVVLTPTVAATSAVVPTPTVTATPTAAAPAPAVAAAGAAKTIQVGTSGPVVMLSGMPNATAIGTVVQNSVRAATIQTQTTINATLNSLNFLNSMNIANSTRQQIAAGP